MSHEQTITVELDGRHYVIPTVINGRKVSNEFASDALKAGSIKPISVHSSAWEAETAARTRSANFPEPDGRPTGANPKGGYDMKALRKEVASARRVGATDDDLIGEIENHPVLGPRVRKMLEAGRTPTQTLDALSGQDIVDEKYNPVEGMEPGERMRAGMGAGLARARLGLIQLLESTADPERKAEIARQIEEMERINKPIDDDPWGMAGGLISDAATSAAPGSAAFSLAGKVVPKIDKMAGWGNRTLRAGASLIKSAAGGIGGQAVVPEAKSMDFSDYLDKAASGAQEGMIGDVAARVGGRFIKPLRFDIDPEYAKRLKRLYEAGIGKATKENHGYGAFDLQQLTGDHTLRDLKSVLSKMPLFSTTAQKRSSEQLGDYTAAVTSRSGFPAPTRNVSKDTLGGAHTAMETRAGEYAKMDPVDMDRPLVQKLWEGKRQHTPALSHDMSALKPIDDAIDLTRGSQVSLPADVALRERKRLSKEAHRLHAGRHPGAEETELVQDAVDDAIKRSFEKQSPGSGEGWETFRDNWRNLLDVQQAAGSPNGVGPSGELNPKALAQVGRAENKKAMASGRATDIQNLSDDAQAVLVDQVPNSGTPQRSLYTMALLGLTRLAGGEGVMGAAGNAVQLGIGPMLASHLLYNERGPLSKGHIVHGAFGKHSDEVMRQLQEKFPGFTAALIERLSKD